jgi:isoleucyl-tRNA synthetase
MHLVTIDQNAKKVLREMSDIIREELNVKDVIFRENEQDLVEYSAKANFKVLGKLLGPRMKSAAAKIAQLEPAAIQSLLDGATLNMDVEGDALEITLEHVIIQRLEKENLKVLNECHLTVALDPEITEELKQEGLARDIIRTVQNMRKQKEFDVSDRIALYIDGDEEIIASVNRFREHISNETLSTDIIMQRTDSSEKSEVNEKDCWIDVQKK